MEAATPLNRSRVGANGDVLSIEYLQMRDETAAALVRERLDAGGDPAELVRDTIEIGARVLAREHTEADAEFVRAEFEKVAKEVENEFGERARAVAEGFERKVDEVFHPEAGALSKSLDQLFSDGSSTAVQHRVKELVGEALLRSREELLRQFSAADGTNPLADFKQSTLAALERAEKRRGESERDLAERLEALKLELQGLRHEKAKLEEVAEERERGTAKGRSYEEDVAEALDAIAVAQGDVAEAVGDERGAGGRKGDVVVTLDASRGPACGALVFEAKDRRLSKPDFYSELDAAMAQRDSDYGVLVVPSAGEVPAKLHSLREYQGNKLVAVYDPEDGSTLELEFAYRLARARVVIAREAGDDLDLAQLRATVDRAGAAMDNVRKVKSQLTQAKGSIDTAQGVLGSVEVCVREELAALDALLAAA